MFLGDNGITKRTKFVRQIGNKMYELKDHLGNVRVVVSDRKLGTVGSSGFTDFVNIEELPDGTLKNTNTAGAWANGCASLEKMGGDCFVEYTITDYDSDGSLTENRYVMVGLSYENASEHYSTIDYNFYTRDLHLTARENGEEVQLFSNVVEGDVLRIAREGTDIKYYLNGTLLRTTAEFQTGDSLLVDISTYSSLCRICGLTFGQELDNYSYSPDIVSSTDYYPFGMVMPGRTFSSDRYRYGFNGMEKDDEVSGSGNSYTAEYWQYDSRLGRRWNIDPVVKYHESSYATFANNPIWFRDPNGADTAIFDSDNNFVEIKPGGEDIGQKLGDEGFFFELADPANDLEAMRKNHIRKLMIPSDEKILAELDRVGVNDFLTGLPIANLLYLANNSHAGSNSGLLDFTVKSEIFGVRSDGEPYGLPKSFYYITTGVLGDKTGHNESNFGNFLWGASASSINVSLLETLTGAHANNFLNDDENRNKDWSDRSFDSKDDQKSITLGWLWRETKW